MPQRRWFLAVASLLILVLAIPRAWSQSAKDDAPTVIRVGLLRSFKNAKQLTVTATSNYSVLQTGSANRIASFDRTDAITIQIAGSQLSLVSASGAPAAAGTSVTIAPADEPATIAIDSPGLQSRRYRGRIEISLRAAALQVINVIDLEDYLPGVLVGEMPSSFPEEALKSQAVAARCYTLCARQKHNSAGFDLCDSVHCQVFDGCLHETAKAANAVAATRGQVLRYKGKIASVMYHGDCGGATQCYSDVYRSGSYPYLCGVAEPSGVPYSTWEKSYKPAELAAKLQAAGIKEADGLQKLAVTKTSASGRAIEVVITGATSAVAISGARLRMILGTGTMRSTLFAVETEADGTITFKGKGHGHGIGMSQVGAKALAEAPFNYTYAQILDHYFPGTTLSRSTEGTKSPTPPTDAKPQGPPTPTGKTRDPGPWTGVRVQEPKL